jgi:hypothetical protein
MVNRLGRETTVLLLMGPEPGRGPVGETVRGRLGTPAQQAAYFADLARARTLQALGDRVGTYLGSVR